VVAPLLHALTERKQSLFRTVLEQHSLAFTMTIQNASLNITGWNYNKNTKINIVVQAKDKIFAFCFA
jgi:hypothetical protein